MVRDPEHVSKYRSHVVRCLLVSQDRADITFTVNELCRKMSDPTQHSFAKLKRLVRYLKGERQWSQVFEFKNMSSEALLHSNFVSFRASSHVANMNRFCSRVSRCSAACHASGAQCAADFPSAPALLPACAGSAQIRYAHHSRRQAGR